MSEILSSDATAVAHVGRQGEGAQASLDEGLAAATALLWNRAARFDVDAADPAALCAPLHTHGLFVAALPVAAGGGGLDTAGTRLARVLMMIGGADLSAGRILEGHVNAVKLVFRYGDAAQKHRLALDVHAGAVCGVWNAEAAPGLRLDLAADGGGRLAGGKIYCSGIGVVTRPLFTAKTPDGGVVMLAPKLVAPSSQDLSGWTVRGMRATATGSIDFTGVTVGADDMIGAPGDYYRGPLFKGGAWRFAAVQTGAVLRIASLMRAALRGRGRNGDPHQKARIGAIALMAETAELWCSRASALVEGEGGVHDPAAVDAYVNLARLAVERAALEVIQLTERGVGLSAFTRPDPIERVVRDLSTYLRQPFTDGALEDAADFVSRLAPGPPWSVSAHFPP